MALAWALWRHGYDGIDHERRGRTGSTGADTFATRLLGRRTVVLRGPAGARLFYDDRVVRRRRAVPLPLAAVLFGRGAVHGLDGATHAARKRTFLAVLADDATDRLVDDMAARLRQRARAWTEPRRLFDELVEVYGAAVLRWSGAPVPERHLAAVSHALAAIVDGFGLAPGAYPRAVVARRRADRWATGAVERVRSGEVVVPDGSPTAAFARLDVDARTAGVELLNVLRPTVAVAWQATHAADLLLRDPALRDRFADPAHREERLAFVHESRRTRPFAPALTGLVRHRAEHDGVTLGRGDRLVLDMVGTNERYAAGGDCPQRFDRHRFRGHEPDPYAFVPQGGGAAETGHRCPGEPLTVRMVERTLLELARGDVERVAGGEPPRGRIPTLPEPPLVVSRRPGSPAR